MFLSTVTSFFVVPLKGLKIVKKTFMASFNSSVGVRKYRKYTIPKYVLITTSLMTDKITSPFLDLGPRQQQGNFPRVRHQQHLLLFR